MRLIAAALIVAFFPFTVMAADAPGLWESASVWILEQQRQLHRELAAGLGRLSDEGGFSAASALISVSFLYGVFHAAGPGHGKAILATYLLTHPKRLAHGVRLAVASAFAQGLTAVALVYGLIFIAGLLPRDAQAAVGWSERLSFALVAAIGGTLIYRAAKGLLALRSRPAAFTPVSFDALRQGAHHVHGPECGCGHAHAPSPQQIERASDFRTSLGIVLSVGLRPCSGAVLVLVLAYSLGLGASGVFAVVAMSTGTAITVAAMALLAVSTRNMASSLVRVEGNALGITANLTAMAGGVIILLLGGSLLLASFASSHPLGL